MDIKQYLMCPGLYGICETDTNIEEDTFRVKTNKLVLVL